MAKKRKKKGKHKKKQQPRYEGGLLSEYILPKKELKKKFEKRVEEIERIQNEEMRIRKKHARFNRKKKEEIRQAQLLLEDRRRKRKKLIKRFGKTDDTLWEMISLFLDRHLNEATAYASLAALGIVALLKTGIIKHNISEVVLSGVSTIFHVLVSI